jgi:hypothetical protein
MCERDHRVRWVWGGEGLQGIAPVGASLCTGPGCARGPDPDRRVGGVWGVGESVCEGGGPSLGIFFFFFPHLPDPPLILPPSPSDLPVPPGSLPPPGDPPSPQERGSSLGGETWCVGISARFGGGEVSG